MADGTAAERQRRYRRRKKAHDQGDHSLCRDDATCRAAGSVEASPVTADVTPSVTLGTLPQFGASGGRLWRDLDGDQASGTRLTLLVEACRIADRLDRLDGILTGDPGEWLRFRVSGDGDEVTVTVDRVLAEARQQASVLKQLVAELRQSGGTDEQDQGGNVLDELAAQRAKRLANAAGG